MSIEKLQYLSILKISGEDADTFLQGQLTNDINQLDGDWQYSGYCSPKGRLIALFNLWKTNDTVYVLVSTSLVDSVVKQLRMYVMRSKVTIETVESATIYGVFGIAALDTITQMQHSNALKKNAVNTANDLTVLTVNASRFIVISPNRLEIDIENNIDNNNGRWSIADVEEGIPIVTLGSSELFIPQMLNLDILNGINFKKGCYTGQEIVARMHYLGKLKQRMFVCDLNSDNVQRPNGDSAIEIANIGDKIYTDVELKKSVGNIVNIADNQSQLLAVLRLDHIDQTLKLNQQVSLTVAPKQPYAVVG